MGKEMATHSSVLAWRIPGTEEPGGCRLWGRTESGTMEATLQQQQQRKAGAGRPVREPSPSSHQEILRLEPIE